MGNLDKDQIKNMVAKMEKDGFYIFDSKLSKDTIQSIYKFSLNEPLNYVDVDKDVYSVQKILFDENNLVSPRYRLSR